MENVRGILTVGARDEVKASHGSWGDIEKQASVSVGGMLMEAVCGREVPLIGGRTLSGMEVFLVSGGKDDSNNVGALGVCSRPGGARLLCCGRSERVEEDAGGIFLRGGGMVGGGLLCGVFGLVMLLGPRLGLRDC